MADDTSSPPPPASQSETHAADAASETTKLERASATMQMFDKDRNGAVEAGELLALFNTINNHAKTEELKKTLDLDNDGDVNRQEIEKTLKAANMLQTDTNGKLTRDSKYLAERLDAAFHKDEHREYLTSEGREMMERPEERGLARASSKELMQGTSDKPASPSPLSEAKKAELIASDTNHDGTIDKQEAYAYAAAHADKNGDGKVNKAEFTAAIRKLGNELSQLGVTWNNGYNSTVATLQKAPETPVALKDASAPGASRS